MSTVRLMVRQERRQCRTLFILKHLRSVSKRVKWQVSSITFYLEKLRWENTVKFIIGLSKGGCLILTLCPLLRFFVTCKTCSQFSQRVRHEGGLFSEILKQWTYPLQVSRDGSCSHERTQGHQETVLER